MKLICLLQMVNFYQISKKILINKTKLLLGYWKIIVVLVAKLRAFIFLVASYLCTAYFSSKQNVCIILAAIRGVARDGWAGQRDCGSAVASPVRVAGRRRQRLPQQTLRRAGPEVGETQPQLDVSRKKSIFLYLVESRFSI